MPIETFSFLWHSGWNQDYVTLQSTRENEHTTNLISKVTVAAAGSDDAETSSTAPLSAVR